jgi:hypothetical protein
MKVIPSKLVPTGKQPMGVKNFSEVEVEMVKLLPNAANSTQAYSYTHVNRIQFRIPSFTNSFMDNSRSFLSYDIKTTTAGANATNDLKITNTPGGWIQRLVIKSSNGLVLEDISDYNVLKKVLTSMEAEEDAKIDEGNFIGLGNFEQRHTVAGIQNQYGATYVLKFNTGILSQHLSSYLPLHIMDNGSYALDVELYLAQDKDVLEYISNDVAPPGGVSGYYVITNPTFNLCLVKVDESICKKYNQIACDEKERVVIPYTTFHSHQSSISAQNQTVFISDNCTDLKRVYSVFSAAEGNKPGNSAGANTPAFHFLGAVHDETNTRLISYNFKLGNKFIYNEDVQEVLNNNISLNHFINAHYKGAKPCCPAMFINKRNYDDEVHFASNYETRGDFVLCPNFTYSEEANKGVIQGVSAGGLPITAVFKFAASPASQPLINHNFVECGYDLVIQHGQLSYVEHRLDGEYSY